MLKILILKPSSLGDVIHALPVLRILRRRFPHATIDWWIDADLAPLLAADPDLTRLVPFPRRRWRSPRYWPEVLQSLRHLHAQHYDWVLDLQALARSALFAWFANARLTVGLDDLREGAAAFYDLRVGRPTPHTHAVDWYLRVLDALQIDITWDFDWIPRQPDRAADVQRKWQTAGCDWVLLVPGARWGNKRWPIGSFVALVRSLAASDPRLRFAVLGGPGDRDLGAHCRAACPTRCVDLTGQTTLPEMVEWIRLSRIVVTNDTGPMHIAAAVGVPVAALFGPTDPSRTGPYRQSDRVFQARLSCVPCMKSRCRHPRPLECLRAVTEEAVADRVRSDLRR